MRTYKEVTKTVTATRLAEVRCDLCGAIAEKGDWDSSSYAPHLVTRCGAFICRSSSTRRPWARGSAEHLGEHKQRDLQS